VRNVVPEIGCGTQYFAPNWQRCVFNRCEFSRRGVVGDLRPVHGDTGNPPYLFPSCSRFLVRKARGCVVSETVVAG
jgi:hypothetical protein